MKQITIKIEAFVTVTVPDTFMNGSIITQRDTDLSNIPIDITVDTFQDNEESCVMDVVEVEITNKEISNTVEL